MIKTDSTAPSFDFSAVPKKKSKKRKREGTEQAITTTATPTTATITTTTTPTTTYPGSRNEVEDGEVEKAWERQPTWESFQKRQKAERRKKKTVEQTPIKSEGGSTFKEKIKSIMGIEVVRMELIVPLEKLQLSMRLEGLMLQALRQGDIQERDKTAISNAINNKEITFRIREDDRAILQGNKENADMCIFKHNGEPKLVKCKYHIQSSPPKVVPPPVTGNCWEYLPVNICFEQGFRTKEDIVFDIYEYFYPNLSKQGCEKPLFSGTLRKKNLVDSLVIENYFSKGVEELNNCYLDNHCYKTALTDPYDYNFGEAVKLFLFFRPIQTFAPLLQKCIALTSSKQEKLDSDSDSDS
eukprot:CAMPEP_0174263606 /NCGR_PEP_ID=MMETSP0439-20130205/19300_1 /TAXON_ID=0 /ORGANISM="Stereomyxa ramosa, Strain Chinc5" /LENGTH=353 /DNA_ID=CAMNT_0015349031 /DNA_START=311 /DNA_END=1368 /DNA_ORIENTATION=-